MPTFITIGYGDSDGYEKTDAAVRDRGHAHDAELQAAGALLGTAGKPVQVRNHDDRGTTTEPGPFLRSALPVAGFMLLEANDLDDAIAKVAQSPCAMNQGVIEVWPLQT